MGIELFLFFSLPDTTLRTTTEKVQLLFNQKSFFKKKKTLGAAWKKTMQDKYIDIHILFVCLFVCFFTAAKNAKSRVWTLIIMLYFFMPVCKNTFTNARIYTFLIK